jgi:HEAT repeat protein
MLSPEALAARHVTFGWFAAQQMRKPIIPVLVRPLPDLLLLEDIPRLDFVQEDPWEVLIVRVWDAALSVLLTRLWHTDPAVRLAAIEALGELGDRRAAWPLTERLRDSDPDVRIAAIDVLRVLKDEGCIPALMMLVNDSNPAVADTARAALSAFPPEKTGLTG